MFPYNLDKMKNALDKRNILKNESPFGYKILKDNKAQLFSNNKLIFILSGKHFIKLQNVIKQNDSYKIQLFIAKIEGQFKRGNEKLNKNI